MHQQARLHALWKINCHYTLNFIFVGFVFLNSHSEKYFFGNKRLQLCIDKFMVFALVIASLCFLCKHFLHTFVVPWKEQAIYSYLATFLLCRHVPRSPKSALVCLCPSCPFSSKLAQRSGSCVAKQQEPRVSSPSNSFRERPSRFEHRMSSESLCDKKCMLPQRGMLPWCNSEAATNPDICFRDMYSRPTWTYWGLAINPNLAGWSQGWGSWSPTKACCRVSAM